MYGGIEDCGPNATKIAPCGDIYSMRLSLSKLTSNFFQLSNDFIFLTFSSKTTPLFSNFETDKLNHKFPKTNLDTSIFRGMSLGIREKVLSN